MEGIELHEIPRAGDGSRAWWNSKQGYAGTRKAERENM
jgi:hypothetical protein